MKYRINERPVARMAIAGALTCAMAGAGLAGSLAGAGAAYAAGTTRYVGASAGSDTSCASPGYKTVQAAVDAARPGDTVYLCGTAPFPGPVVITRSITLTGSAGATIGAPAGWTASAGPLPPQFASDGLLAPQALVVAWGHGVHVTIRGLDITGPLPGNGGCGDEEYGILVLSGARAAITDDAVTNIEDANAGLYGCQFGVGIEIGSEYWPTPGFAFKVEDFTGSATITGTTVSGYQKNGITADGPGASVSISGDTITGAGPASALGRIIAQNGIQVSDGASGQVSRDTVSANQYSGPGNASSTGLLIYGGCGDPLVKNVTVTGNTFTSNDVGVYLFNAAANCTDAPGTRTGDSVRSNRISDPAVTNTSGYSMTPRCGYQAGVADLGNHDAIIGNAISGAGYASHPTCSAAQPYVSHAVDTTGAIDPLVALNY